MSPHRETEGDAHRPVCPGLSSELAWDAVTALRGELYASEHLVSHAQDVARAHGRPSRRITPGPLRKRFASARSQIRAAYEILARDVKNRRDPSPAEEWLLDNSHVVDEQIREIQEDLPWGYLIELPRIAHGAMRGYPRVYGLCLDYLRHTDARVDLQTLAEYVVAYQQVATLTTGELWAIPIMLRLGLSLLVGALAVSEANARDRQRADVWADRLIVDGANSAQLERSLALLGKSAGEIGPAFLVQLLKRVRDHDAPLSPVQEWIQARCDALGTTPEELTRREHLRQAADQVSVGNSITSMRAIAALDWTQFFELTSSVEAVLREDPCGAYPLMDAPSRDRCRHVVEQLARRCTLPERSVAERALGLAKESQARNSEAVAESHVGYYLLDAGRPQLERIVHYRPSLSERFTRPILAYPSAFYLSSIGAIVAGLCWLAFEVLRGQVASPWAVVGLSLLASIPASEIASALVNALVLFVLPPRLLPKLDFEAGIPDEHRALVVVPALLESRAGIRQLLEDLEVRALANPGSNLYFALVTDFVDADAAETPADLELLSWAEQGIEQLNQRWNAGESHYFLLHRRRVHNPTEGRFMGWERKRGKLEELNRLLRGASDTTFSVVTAPSALLTTIRYVITLDADTDLPREVARRLVGALAHPQNRPVLDPTRQRVVRGYGIIQPRVGTLPLSSRRSRFAQIFSGPPGIDPYTTAVSDLYQDLHGEGSFVGKGIYDVDAFQAALRGRVPDNHLLSHDLFESSFARSALATDIEVLDEQPATYEVVASREHRWLRGDWQLLPWLLPSVPVRGGGRRPADLRLLDRWRIIDNLRRSLVAPSLVVLLLSSWLASASLAKWSLGLLAGVFLGPLLMRQVLSFAREVTAPRPTLAPLGGALTKNLQATALSVVTLLDRALLCGDGILRTLYRLLISRRNLLEWTTMSQAARRQGVGGARSSTRFIGSAWLAVALACCIAALRPSSLPFALPLLALWALAPALLGWLGQAREQPAADSQISASGRLRLRLLARKTWRFFDTFVTAADNWLPPDNYQEDPRGIVAHRTSPTNIGLYLLSVVAARDLGFLTVTEALQRLDDTLATLQSMERRAGHILNWYDTTNLRPLEPQYISTVDSGNLAGYLWTLREACADLTQAPLFDAQSLAAARDALLLARAAARDSAAKANAERAAEPSALDPLQAELDDASQQAMGGAVRELERFERFERAVSSLLETAWGQGADAETRYWLLQAGRIFSHARAQALNLAPSLAWLSQAQAELPGLTPEPLRSLTGSLAAARTPAQLAEAASRCLTDLPRVQAALVDPEALSFVQRLAADCRATQHACQALAARAAGIAERAVELANDMDFEFLYDHQRALFSIGYNVSSARLDSSHYDLLASEARLASLIAISKGDAPLEHWWKLARPRTATSAGRALLSWSGSMFEYLMPLLVTGANRDTLLWETCRSAVGRQVDYAAEQGLPWGISEAAYNVMDLGMNYQYRAFGVPGLGLKSGLGADRVVAPYATLLATLVRPDLALANLERLDRAGLDGKYGYYESVDYTPGHVPPERSCVIVKAFMAHHQGMSLVAVCNVLCNWPMQRRFFADARIKASALLLEERLPLSSPTIAVRADQVTTPLLGEVELHLTDHVGPRSPGVQRLHLLGHGELSSIISASGSGALTWKGLDVTRFREDAALDESGTFVFVRDLSSQRLWSVGTQPTGAVPDYYDAAFSIDRVELKRRDGNIETVMEVAVSPESPLEIRQLTLTNHGAHDVELDLTTYTEPVLAPRGADVAHRAFSSMFLEAELLPERGAILLRRRPRSATEAETWLIQVLNPDGAGFGPAELEASRSEFIGRGGSLARPQALRFDRQLSGTSGNVLDPGLALRRQARVGAGQRVRATLTTGLANSREEALQLLELVLTPSSGPRAFELAWADARVELRHLGITAARSHRFQRLLSCLIYAPSALRAQALPTVPLSQGQSALWAHGISGDLPVLLLRVDAPDFGELCRELLLAHEFWRLNGVRCDLVLLNEEPEGYLQPLQVGLTDLVTASPAHGNEGKHGGVFLLRSTQMSTEQYALLLRAARVVLRASDGSLSQQLRRAAVSAPQAEPLPVVRRRAPHNLTAMPPGRGLHYFNGIGGFSSDGREYVMSIGPGARSPAPWCNVLSNPSFGSVISESGLGFSWCGNSQRERLTPWSNDAVADAAGELLYLRDQEDGYLWSATPAPASLGVEFTVRHGQGYSIFSHVQGDIEHELTVLVSPEHDVKLWRLRLKNRGRRRRRLAIYGVVEWVLGPSRESTRLQVVTTWEAEAGVLLANNPFAPRPQAHAFLACNLPVASVSGDRHELFGQGGSRERPAGLERSKLSGRTGSGLDPCGALQVLLAVAPGESVEACFALGHADSAQEALELARRFKSPDLVQRVYSSLGATWDGVCSITASTPDNAFDLMLNRWLPYQVTAARLWARSGFYQSSGAYGFRDQLQDVLALLHARPDLAREHLLRAGARQFVEGDVQHWWHPEKGDGVRTHCSDDMLFLPYAVACYVRTTGDAALLDEPLPFLEERELEREEDDLFNSPRASQETASVYEHCLRALQRGSTSGPHGLPKIGTGDWNDGMNRVGRLGSGESVWLAWFLRRTLLDFAPLARQRGEHQRADSWDEQAERLRQAVEAHAWDGAWYRRAYYDDGTPLGSHESLDCRVDAIAQSWSVIAAGDTPRSRQAVESSLSELVVEDQRLMRLLTPPFTHHEHDPGYIRSYPEGVRENGGQYTHGVLWTVQALCLLGEGDQAYRLFSMLNPITHALTPEDVKRYRVEPYVLAADVYSSAEHPGRGGWTWYTGSASWMYRIAVEHVLGLTREGDWLLLAPCIPRDWGELQVTYRYGKSELRLSFENPSRVSSGVELVELDERPLPDARVPLLDDGRRHHARVLMGSAEAGIQRSTKALSSSQAAAMR